MSLMHLSKGYEAVTGLYYSATAIREQSNGNPAERPDKKLIAASLLVSVKS